MATLETANEEAIKKIEAQLECAFCLRPYTKPKFLPCSHVFCEHCLEDKVVQVKDGPTIACCRTIAVPPNGVAGFPSAFLIQQFLEVRDTLKEAKQQQKKQCGKCNKATATSFCRDCDRSVCPKCIELHQQWEELANHRIEMKAASLAPPRKKAEDCPKHQKHVLKIFCEECQELICNECTVELHKGHKYDLVFPKHRDEILSHLQPVREHLDKVNKALKTLDTRTKEITDQRMDIEADIHKRINQLLRVLEQRRTELIGQLKDITQKKLDCLADQEERIKPIKIQLSSCLEEVEGHLKTANERNIMATKAPVLKQIQEVTGQFNPDTLDPEQEADMIMIIEDDADLTEACKKFAQVDTNTVDPPNCHTTGDGLLKATVGEQKFVTLHTVKRDGRDCRQPVKDLTAELVFCKDGTVAKCGVKQEGKSVYGIRYQPVTRGKHQLHITIKGKQTKGSPHTVAVRRPTLALGNPITTIGNLNTLWGIVTDSKGRIIVTEYGAHCVSIFTPEGQKIRSFGNHGTANGQFSNPSGVTVDSDDNIYVADYGNHRIPKFTPDGEFIATAGSQGSNPLQFYNPIGIGYNSTNDKLYVCDNSNNRIQILERSLDYWSTFGSGGGGDGQFSNPWGVGFDTVGNVFIAEYSNQRIQVFTPEGQFLRKFGSPGSGPGQLSYPIDIALDDATLYITENGNHRVSIFTTQGEFLRTFGTQGNGQGQFSNPRGITVDENGFIVVADHSNCRIEIF